MAVYSCGIAIWNDWITGMRRIEEHVVYGAWGPEPPEEIDPGQLVNFRLNGSETQGPDGSVTYQFSYSAGDQQLTATVEFIFANPSYGPNIVDWRWQNMPDPRFNGTVTFFARSALNPWGLNSVQASGLPVDAIYTLFGNVP
jgi:hypothetical protein